MTVTIRLTSDEETRLAALAARTGRTKSFYVRTALRAHLEDLEDTYAADEATREFEADGRATRPLAELVKKLGITSQEWDRAEHELRTSDTW